MRRDDDPHHVTLYRDADGLTATTTAFLAAPLLRGEAVVLIATPDHRSRCAQALAEAGVDVVGARVEGRYLELDAAATLAAFHTEAGPSTQLFCSHVVAVVASLAARFGAVSAYGEMVGLLAAAGQVVAALELEALWAEAMAELPLRLLCGYPSGALGDEELVAHVCAAHDLLAPVPSSTVVVDLPTGSTAGLAARHALVHACRSWGLRDEEWVDEASLLVSELVGNAVRHTQSVPALQLDRYGDVLSVVVVDGSVVAPRRRTTGGLAERGRGLQVIEALAERWGVETRPLGKAVWARTRPCPVPA